MYWNFWGFIWGKFVHCHIELLTVCELVINKCFFPNIKLFESTEGGTMCGLRDYEDIIGIVWGFINKLEKRFNLRILKVIFGSEIETCVGGFL